MAIWLCKLESTGHDLPSTFFGQIMNQVAWMIDENRRSIKDTRIVFSFVRHSSRKKKETVLGEDQIVFSQLNAEFRQIFGPEQPVHFENTTLTQSARDTVEFPRSLVEKLSTIDARDPVIFVLNGVEVLTVNIKNWR